MAVDGDAEFQNTITQKYGNDYDFIRLMSNLGAKFSEHKIPTSGEHVTKTPAEHQTAIDDATANPAFMDRAHPQHKQAVETVTRLYKQKAG